MEALEKITSAIGKKLEGRKPSLDRDDNLWDAAVLLPLVNTPQGVSVLFEVRAAKLGWQPGDVCFPGGRAECSDESFEATAVRETCEELGLESSSIKIAGGLNYLVTHMGPVIHPYVGYIEHSGQFNFNKDEVDEVFTVPLDFLLKILRALPIWNWQIKRGTIFRLTFCRASRTNGINEKATMFIFTNMAATLSGG